MDAVLAKRGNEERSFSRDAWQHMVESGATYGWELVNKVPDELKALQNAAGDPGAANDPLQVFPDDLDKIQPKTEAGAEEGAGEADPGDENPGEADEPGEAEKPRRGRPKKDQ